MTLGAAFDGSMVYTRDMKFHNLERTRHIHQLEEDYRILRDHGFTFFRDSVGVAIHGWNYEYLQRLAKISQGQIQLTLCHYEYETMWHAESLAARIASEFKGAFHSYIPVCEAGYWCRKLTEDWLPHYPDWWSAYGPVSEMMIQMAKAMKQTDPGCKIAMAEPWFWDNMEDLARPFNTMMGCYDWLAEVNGCYTHQKANEWLLDIIGLNIYNQPDVRKLIIKAQSMFPGKQIMITETSCLNTGITPADHIAFMERETAGTACDIVCWCPALQHCCFERGEPIAHGYLYDLNRQKVY